MTEPIDAEKLKRFRATFESVAEDQSQSGAWHLADYGMQLCDEVERLVKPCGHCNGEGRVNGGLGIMVPCRFCCGSGYDRTD